MQIRTPANNLKELADRLTQYEKQHGMSTPEMMIAASRRAIAITPEIGQWLVDARVWVYLNAVKEE